MKKMLSKVVHPTGITRHNIGQQADSGIEARAEFKPAVALEIWPDQQGFLLIRLDHQQDFAGDTWHASIEEAKAQAFQEFHVGAIDWIVEP